MASNRRSARFNADTYALLRRTPRSYCEPPVDSDASDSEPPVANAEEAESEVPEDASNSRQAPQPLLAPAIIEQPTSALPPVPAPPAEPPRRERANRRAVFVRNRRRGGRDAIVASPPRGSSSRPLSSLANSARADQFSYEHDLALALAHEMLNEDASLSADESDLPTAWRGFGRVTLSAPRLRLDNVFAGGWGGACDTDGRSYGLLQTSAGSRHFLSDDDAELDASSAYSGSRSLSGPTKRSRDRFEASETGLQRTLNKRGAVAVMLYRTATPNAEANDIWPEFRNAAKLPARYSLLDKSRHDQKSKRRPQKMGRRAEDKGKQPEENYDEIPAAPSGRSKWDLPVELVELIAGYLNRDDIKSLRMVSHELNYYVSQVIFKTVVVPFNTEIYGMLATGQKPDFKGKKRAKLEQPGYSWKNANGDEVYNGHGLDVFRGFGRHILRYGMSFEVNEDSLSQPPVKSLTERKTSFWGAYDWPFEEYRRFDAVAGLETAADETPRMKIAFSELTRIKELALSIDSGLGWLNGPDRSIRARILRRPPAIFGTLKDVPDRRAQAQQELWGHIERRHQEAGQDIKFATLYRADGLRPPSELEVAGMLAEEQPAMAYLDPHVINEAVPHESNESTLPTSFDDPDVLDRFVLSPATSSSGILFSSTTPPSDAGQIMSPIIPANLTEAQKEWLLETEWAQRAFMSSYMLSIIDNPTTFTPVHTLNISRLSDRYLSMLNRSDFWDALPNLSTLTILVIPGWRSVHKDEAGFVDTPRINPITGLDPFCELLSQHVANRSGIHNLTIGWIGGGEHAEGLHARNKLIMPAPLMPLESRTDSNTVFASDMMNELDPNRIRSSLLQFPHVEQLTLRNCWITPAALQQFVKLHDTQSLKHLSLDSVSLTAILRPNGIAHQANAHGNAHNAHAPGPLPPNALLNALHAFNGLGAQPLGQANAHALPNHQHFQQFLVQSLQAQVQQLQGNAGNAQVQNQMTALQTQLQQQIQQLQAQNQQQDQPVAPPGAAHHHVQPIAPPQLGANQPAAVAAAIQVQAMLQQAAIPGLQNPPTSANPQSALLNQPREGSWMSIIDIISPGTNLGDFDSEHSKADPDRQTSLQSIQFISCGYAKLPHTPFDQSAIEHGNPLAALFRSSTFSKRHHALNPAMLGAKWAHLGEVVQEVDLAELAALDAGWNLKTGWDDAEEARAVEFDGCLTGGTGRFSGTLRASDRMRDADEAGSANANALSASMSALSVSI